MGNKQKVTAFSMAEFLRTATLSENTQRQIWRDQELLARATQRSPAIQDTPHELEVVDIEMTDDQDLQVYGDF